jgi:delta24(24(1))-sterol reductase
LSARTDSFDTSMAQKSRFKMEQAGNYRPRYTFPQLPYSHLSNPRFLQTKHGKLLIDGWWAYLRKPVRLRSPSLARA